MFSYQFNESTNGSYLSFASCGHVHRDTGWPDVTPCCEARRAPPQARHVSIGHSERIEILIAGAWCCMNDELSRMPRRHAGERHRPRQQWFSFPGQIKPGLTADTNIRNP